MKIKQLIKQLKEYPEEAEIYISNDSEGNEIKTIDQITITEKEEKNNDRTHKAIVIYPTDTIIEQLTRCHCENPKGKKLNNVNNEPMGVFCTRYYGEIYEKQNYTA